ncbi:MAG: hypothetical protein RL757_1342 [Bacteroidota bacterium]|jgi:ribosome-associated heat shock protein Hsp15
MPTLEKVRIDKWLWAIRVFKSRTMSSDACKGDKVKINGVNAKASAMTVVGDSIEVKKDGFTYTYKVLQLLEQRVSATLAAPCYENLTPEAELKKFEAWFAGNEGRELRGKGTGRPTKRDRRAIDKLKDN